MPRVPLSISEAKNLVSTLPEIEFKNSEIPSYSWVERESNYGGIRQRWLVVKSEARAESDLASLEKKIAKEFESTQKKITKLCQQTFSSYSEAELSLKLIQSKLKFHLIDDIKITESGIENQEKTYQITGVLQANSESIELFKNRAGRFIIATNRLDRESFSCDEMLIKYKEQQNVERGESLSQRPIVFCVKRIFLKSPRRIETMAMSHGFMARWFILWGKERFVASYLLPKREFLIN